MLQLLPLRHCEWWWPHHHPCCHWCTPNRPTSTVHPLHRLNRHYHHHHPLVYSHKTKQTQKLKHRHTCSSSLSPPSGVSPFWVLCKFWGCFWGQWLRFLCGCVCVSLSLALVSSPSVCEKKTPLKAIASFILLEKYPLELSLFGDYFIR